MSKYLVANPKTKNATRLQPEGMTHLIMLILLFGMVVVGLRSRSLMALAAGLIVVYLLWIPSERSIEVLLFGMSFINVFKFSHSSSSLFTFIQVVPLIKILFIEKEHNLQKRSLIMLAVLILYSFLFLYTGIGPIFKIFIGFLLIICIIQSKTFEKLNCKRLVLFYSCGIITSSVCAMLFPNLVEPYVSSLVVRLEDESAVGRFSGLFSNPNYFSIEISIALACHVVLYISNEENGKELMLIGIPLIILGIMSQSNGFIISVIIMSFFLYIMYLRNNAGKAIFVIGIILMLLLLFRRQAISIYNRYFSRFASLEFEDTSLSQITTGRIDIWRMYLEKILSEPKILFLGNGIETTLNRGAHNVFIEMLFCMGIIGSSIYIILLISIIGHVPAQRKYILLFVIVLFRAFSANIAFYNNIYYYYLLLFALRSVKDSNNHEIKKQNIIIENRAGWRYIKV